MTYLLDANVLIALTVEEHEYHDRSTAWAAAIDGFAVCPIVEGRWCGSCSDSASQRQPQPWSYEASGLCRPASSGPTPSRTLVSTSTMSPGHRQVSDAYLVGLARAHSTALAMLDEGLSRAMPEHTVLLPESGSVV